MTGQPHLSHLTCIIHTVEDAFTFAPIVLNL